MLRRYETLMLTVPEITQDETKKLEKEFDRIVADAKGTTLSFERWGKYHLAYPVQKNEYGVYFLARYEVPEGTTLPEELKSLFTIKVNTFVMREVTTLLDPKAPLAYQRPKSLEESPGTRGDVKDFLKEHKMEGLLSSSEGRKPRGQEDVEEGIEAEDKN